MEHLRGERNIILEGAEVEILHRGNAFLRDDLELADQIGELADPDLAPGKWRRLTDREVEYLKNSAMGVEKNADS